MILSNSLYMILTPITTVEVDLTSHVPQTWKRRLFLFVPLLSHFIGLLYPLLMRLLMSWFGLPLILPLLWDRDIKLVC